MKAVIQRVMKASVIVDDRTVGSIGHGLCVFIGINRHDTEKEIDYIVRKILNIRIFSETESKRWMKSVVDMDYEILCISQFTLDVTLKGNKPDFSKAMGPELARSFYNKFLDTLKSRYKPDKIQDGEFGAYMQVHIQNDGPVTIPLETKESKDEGKQNTPNTQSNQGAANLTPEES
uniref:D-aminoacyl-tRNA deacylase n=1 Tax=Arion vulgaris TaxID=1028688 RepID=A0A0B6Y833_9EUPU